MTRENNSKYFTTSNGMFSYIYIYFFFFRLLTLADYSSCCIVVCSDIHAVGATPNGSAPQDEGNS